MESLDQEFAAKPAQPNGQAKPLTEYESFGDDPHQVVPREIMRAMFKDLFATDKPTFARLMWRAYGGDDTDLMPASKRIRGAAG